LPQNKSKRYIGTKITANETARNKDKTVLCTMPYCLDSQQNEGGFKMGRVYNFSAGPAVLPEEVLKEAADEMLDYQGTGMSVMEMSHRSKAYDDIIKTAEKDLRELMNIPDNYKVLFLQGGASQQFAAIPMNLMKNKVADYIITGQWAKKSIPGSTEIRKGKCHCFFGG